ncbi:MAG: hypothetical protein OXU81_14275 [Gammaproteobacteria bacterium]|nr:hypothetical protein [Gammaproteobacteria bacterium]
MIKADEVLVLDSSTFIREIGLMSKEGSALKHYLYCREMPLVVPKAASEEYERQLINRAQGKVDSIHSNLDWLKQFLGVVTGWQAPSDDVVEERAKAVATSGGLGALGAILLPETDDTRTRARHRVQAERPPSHRRAKEGDCRIWEQILELLAKHDVVFVSDDRDFRGYRSPEELHPTLRAEAEAAGPGRRLTFYPEMKLLLRELRSVMPPIQEDAIFEFIYGAISDAVDELVSNSGCHPTSTGTIEQTRLTTDAPDVIEVRLGAKDIWKSAEGAASLPFELSGSCHYHLGGGRFSDLKTDVIRLSMTEPDGSIRSVKGSVVYLRPGPIYLGSPQIHAEQGLLE